MPCAMFRVFGGIELPTSSRQDDDDDNVCSEYAQLLVEDVNGPSVELPRLKVCALVVVNLDLRDFVQGTMGVCGLSSLLLSP